MFARTCSACQRRQLIFANQITDLVNSARGIEVHYDCWCGAEQSFLTGRAAEERLSTVMPIREREAVAA